VGRRYRNERKYTTKEKESDGRTPTEKQRTWQSIGYIAAKAKNKKKLNKFDVSKFK
jgi:hypothetical protein